MSRVHVMGTRAFEGRLSFVSAALLTAPTAALIAVMTLLPARGPLSAAAAQGSQESMPLIVPPVPEPTPEQVALASAMRGEAAAGFQRCPVVSRAPAQDDRSQSRPMPDEPSTGSKAAGPPELTVSSIMSSKGEPCAMINRKLRRLGDEVAPGWWIERIDSSTGVVVIAHAGGQRHELRLRGRGN